MSPDRDRLTSDVSRGLAQAMQETLNVRLRVAATVLDPPEIALVLHELSVGVVLGAMSYMVANIADEAGTDALLDEVEASLVRRLRACRGQVIRTAEALRRGESPAEAVR